MRFAAMLSALLLAVAFVAYAENPPAAVHPDTTGWETLFADPALADAICPPNVWKVEDGVLTASADKGIWSKKQYENFVLDLEFKTAPGTNSGVFFYCTNLDKWTANCLEVQIADDFAEKWAKSPKTWQCGAIFGRLAAKKSMVKKPGEWNRMTVTCKGRNITVAINGEVVTEMDMSKWTSTTKNPDGSEFPKWLGDKPLCEVPTKGHVGLQGKHAGAPIFFRNVKIKTLD